MLKTVEECYADPEVQRTLRYFSSKWKYLDQHLLQSAFGTAIIKSLAKHSWGKQEFKATLARYINWEIKRGHKKNGIKFLEFSDENTFKRNVEQSEASKELSSKVLDWMDKYLGEREKSALRLRLFENSTWKFIANELKCTERMAKSYFSDGLRQLRYVAKSEGMKLCDELDIA